MANKPLKKPNRAPKAMGLSTKTQKVGLLWHFCQNFEMFECIKSNSQSALEGEGKFSFYAANLGSCRPLD